LNLSRPAWTRRPTNPAKDKLERMLIAIDLDDRGKLNAAPFLPRFRG
jgi:hypothetical protein